MTTDLHEIPDAAERMRAIDPAHSFIVQAPAGSGKTGLLIQRYLRLLSCVDHPEEIIAITFTRKAAAEMRERIVNALEAVSNKAAVESAFDQQTHKLAAEALNRDAEIGWHLIDNPMRLRIQTIDALCASLTQQMPILSKFGSQPKVTENAQKLYRDAARATIALLNDNWGVSDDIALLLEHLDNDMTRIETLLAGMLARRDHWLRHIHHGKTRNELEASLENLRSRTVEDLSDVFPDGAYPELLALVRYASANLLEERRASVITLSDSIDERPDTVDQWCGIAELLLKKDGGWRNKVDTRQGFPTGKTKAEKAIAASWKTRLTELIDLLKTSQGLQQMLHDIRSLPTPVYTDMQWRVLGAITRMLPYAVAQLKVTFQLTGQVDFTEVMQCALAALGETDIPTDLSLTLDYHIKHLLIDEFQDTSISQYLLIEKLVAAWQPDDGRSLFVVGDPMQSIYRFREAEVGLFLRARQMGVGRITLQPITLRSNFRSQPGIVDWVNMTFKQIMPAVEDAVSGAVAYTPSLAMRNFRDSTAVTVHPLFGRDRKIEADHVVEVILQSRQRNPEESIAVLVRNRSHLNEIVVSLQLSNLRFRAVEVEALKQKPVVQDLFMLTRALVDPADRLAWLSILRAPWCGLQLTDLQQLVSTLVTNSTDEINPKPQTVFAAIQDQSRWNKLSKDGAKRLRYVEQVLTPCLSSRGRKSLRNTVETAWLALGGPGCVAQPEAASSQVCSDQPVVNGGYAEFSLDDAMTFLDYVEKQERAGNIIDWADFEAGLSNLYAAADFVADNSLQIMTIHKAKGLEFDTVLLPGLGFTPKHNEKQLIRWMEQPRQNSSIDVKQEAASIAEVDLFLAPIPETGKQNDTINLWLEQQEREKANYETDRLLYVAATRARNALHLFGHVNLSKQDGAPMRPKAGSLLNRLWPIVEQSYLIAAKQVNTYRSDHVPDSPERANEPIINQSIKRLVSDWRLPEPPKPVNWQTKKMLNTSFEEIEFSWASEMAAHVGSVVHRWLQRIAEDRLQGWDIVRIQSLRERFARGLLMNGFNAETQEIEHAVERIVIALTNAITDHNGRWILGEQSRAQNEVRLVGVVNNEMVEYVIDRTFCDETKARWIIDYKTSSHEGAGIQEFIDREQERYRCQLNNYARLFRAVEKNPIRLGIYFPMLKAWRTWVY